MMDTDLREASDAALVVAIARFREAALAEVYRRHGDAAFGLAVRVLRDRALAEELVQEVFLKLWQDPERFDPGRGSLRAFLMARHPIPGAAFLGDDFHSLFLYTILIEILI